MQRAVLSKCGPWALEVSKVLSGNPRSQDYFQTFSLKLRHYYVALCALLPFDHSKERQVKQAPNYGSGT